jgi:hypothetical protein
MKTKRIDALETQVELDEKFVTNDFYGFQEELNALIEKYRI